MIGSVARASYTAYYAYLLKVLGLISQIKPKPPHNT